MRLGLIGIAAAAAMALTAPAALAADIPSARPAYKAPVIAAPLFTWTGFYLGVNAGYGWADVGLGGVTIDSDINGFVGGGQIGYNWQFGNFLLGVEADINGSTVGRSDTFLFGAPALAVTVDRDLNWFATVRGRAGLTFDRVLLYVTGGWAYVDYGVDVTVAGLGGLGLSSGSSKSGWTVGGGIEWMFLPKWSVKAEYLYVDVGDTNIFIAGVPVSAEAQLNVVRGGVNFHF